MAPTPASDCRCQTTDGERHIDPARRDDGAHGPDELRGPKRVLGEEIKRAVRDQLCEVFAAPLGMSDHRLVRRQRLALHDGIANGVVVGERPLPPRNAFESIPTIDIAAGIDVAKLCDQSSISSGRVDHAVKFDVRLRIGSRVPRLNSVRACILGAAERFGLIIGDPARGKSRACCFELAGKLQQFAKLAEREFRQNKATRRLSQQILATKVVGGLANRSPRDAEVLGDRRLIELVAGQDPPSNDILPNVITNRLDERCHGIPNC